MGQSGQGVLLCQTLPLDPGDPRRQGNPTGRGDLDKCKNMHCLYLQLTGGPSTPGGPAVPSLPGGPWKEKRWLQHRAQVV